MRYKIKGLIKKAGKLNLMYFAVGIAVTGVTMLAISKASAPPISLEAESGLLSNVAVAVDSTASNGTAIQFGTYRPADPRAITCLPAANPAPPYSGYLANMNWSYSSFDLESIFMQEDLNLPVPNDGAIDMVAITGAMKGKSQNFYIGLTSRGGIYFKVFGDSAEENIRKAASPVASWGPTLDSYRELGTVQPGTFPTGKYTFRITKAEFDGVGDWYNFYAKVPDPSLYPGMIPDGSETYMGGMRFIRTDPNTPEYIGGGMGSSLHYYNTTSVPALDQTLTPLKVMDKFNNTVTPNNGYIAMPDVAMYPNSDVKLLDWNSWAVSLKGGGLTQRCHTSGPLL